MSKADNLVKLLDAAVILMEDGSDFDLTVLDRPVVDIVQNKDTLTDKPDKNEKDEEKDEKPKEVTENM